MRTAGTAEKIILSTETKKLSPGFDAVAIIRARIVDANGVTVPRANDLISFKISGHGVIAAADNSDPASHEAFQSSERHAFHGECAAFIKATGTKGQITVTASATGLKNGSASVQATVAKTE